MTLLYEYTISEMTNYVKSETVRYNKRVAIAAIDMPRTQEITKDSISVKSFLEHNNNTPPPRSGKRSTLIPKRNISIVILKEE